MFCLKEPSTLEQPWRVSSTKEKYVVTIARDVLNNLRRQDILAIDFLYQSYRSKLKGVILNEENDMNSRIQVSAFLGALSKSVSKQFLLLILTPDKFLLQWHYHLTEHGGLKANILTSDTCPDEFYQETNVALLLSFSNLKFVHSLEEYEFFSVVIDNFEEVATKMAIRKIHGNFNIGLTTRNFYIQPDQKLFWTMLNWSNPDTFGKLVDFYKIDDENFAAFRNIYRTWWFRLTWSFCESLKPYSSKEKTDYNNDIKHWAEAHQIMSNIDVQVKRSKSKVIKKDDKNKDTVKIEKAESTQQKKSPQDKKDNPSQKEKVTYKSKGKRKPIKKIEYSAKRKETFIEQEIKEEENSNSSTDTIIYDNTNSESQLSNQNFENEVPPSNKAVEQNNTIDEISPENDDASQESNSSRFEDDFLLSMFTQPAKKRRKITEKCDEPLDKTSNYDSVSSSSQVKNTQGITDLDPDDLILSFLPNSHKSIRYENASNTNEDLGNNNEKPLTHNRYSIRNDNFGEAADFIHSLVSSQSNNTSNTGENGAGNSNIGLSPVKKSSIDRKKLEDLLKEADEIMFEP